MNEILAQLIAAAIDADKIPGLDCFDMSRRPRGQFDIVLKDTTRIRVTVEDATESAVFSDDEARACQCGSVRWNLLRSGNIECAGCQSAANGFSWANNIL
jgi:hypothetical protein